ncbi:hypothetical protein F9278_34580 [Streptomyces phaeolivaceus]|uniref:Uncharacterized protein n=1 Tax=Streptomyces phaeolivaceus TaxID=2653200 RepID=A0A5P8KB27_9ACTN|nr:hypothetical protein F9278_34580 [Streptomyces phaeolivaceus]
MLQRDPFRVCDKSRPEGVMAFHDALHGASQCFRVDLTKKPQHHIEIVSGVARMQPVEEPQFLLGE